METSSQLRLSRSGLGKILFYSSVYRFVMEGWPTTVDPKHNAIFSAPQRVNSTRRKLTFGGRVVVPPSGRATVQAQLHKAHTGISRMKTLSRNYVWWPRIDHDLEQTVNECKAYEEHARSPVRAPLHAWEWPGKPWSRLHIDYAGQFQGHVVVVIVDV